MVIAIGLVTGEVAQHDDWLLQGLGPSAAKFAATLESASPSEIRLQNGTPLGLQSVPLLCRRPLLLRRFVPATTPRATETAASDLLQTPQIIR